MQEYNYGEEFVLLVTFAKNASEKNIKDATDSFAQLTSSLPSLIVQSTQGTYKLYFRMTFIKSIYSQHQVDSNSHLIILCSGSNFNKSSEEFTHAAVVRFRSCNHFSKFSNSFFSSLKSPSHSCLCHFPQLTPWRFSLRAESIKM